MFRNALLLFWRNLKRHKSHSLINIIGLALGMAAFIGINAYVHFEKSFDRMHTDAQNIYRVESRFFKGAVMTDDWPTSTNGYGPAMRDNIPGIASFVRISWSSSERVVRYQSTLFREEHVCFADTNFFSFFSYPLLKGNPSTVLKDVNTVVLSQSTAKKYFGSSDPIGQFLDISTIGSNYHCQVTGIFKDLPPNSTMQFQLLMSWSTSPAWIRDFWYQHESYTFIKLQPGARVSDIEARFPALAEKFKTGDALKELKWAVHLAPLTDIHLTAARQYEVETKGNRRAVQFLQLMSFFILLIACVNYINLSTAKAIERAREVGIRKVSGAKSWHLTLQFLLESTLINIIAALLAIAIVAAARYGLPAYLGDNTTYSLLFDSSLALQCTVIFLLSILLSGIYPALVLTKLRPIVVLKGRYSFSRRGVLLRKGLVSIQFALSLLLIAGTLAVHRQLIFMNNQDPGIRISQMLVLKAPVKTPDYLHKMQSLKLALQAIPGVTGVTGSGAIPGKAVGEFLANRRYGAPRSEERTYEMLKADYDFIPLYDLELIAGHAFDKNRPSDSIGVVLNESAVRQFGFTSPEQSIGQRVWLEVNPGRPNTVIGVIKDYHQQSLQQQYTPLILFMDPAYGWIPTEYFSVRINTAEANHIIPRVQTTWNNFFPESSFDHFFLNDYYDRQYRQDRQFGRLFSLFSSLAIFIACMGLFGLTAYTTARRTKEIGVRKVLGARVTHIVAMLTWDAVRLIAIAAIAALPVAFLLIVQWQQGYAFRATLSWWQFALPVAMLIVIAICTTGWLVAKAALANPTNSLRNE